MAGAELSTAFKLLGAVAKPAAEKLKRQEGVVAVLHRLGMAPDVPPPDFAGVYTYTVVEYCYGKPEPVLRLFQNEYVRSAFEKSFATGDPAHLDREITEILQWNDETGALGRIDYNLAREVTGFSVVFNRLVDRTRTAAETRVERDVQDVRGGVKDIQESLSSLVRRLDRMNTREEILRQEWRDRTPVSRLADELREWFAAVEYKILQEVRSSATDFVWLVRVPGSRRGFDTVVVLGKSGELSAPDVTEAADLVTTHRAAEGWVIVPQRISKAARAADQEFEQVICYTMDELIDERADFEPYLSWLENEIRSRDIEHRFVPLSCVKEEPDRRTGRIAASSHYSWREGGLDEHVRSWVDDNAKEHLSILGEFGMGKSWFSLHFAWTMAQEWRAAKAAGRKRPRLPLVVPLRDYAKAVSIESLFSEFFFRKHSILPDGYRVFETLNRMGRLLLIFDGFDEMAARVDRQSRINNFWELARAVVPGSKVLLTCRTEHFPEAQEGRDVLSAQLIASTSALTGEPPQFEVVELQPFDDEQIARMLERITTDRTRETILQHQDLVDLMRRPVMGEFVLSALPAIERGAKVDLARVYLYAVQHKINADIKAERTFTSLADKVYFLCELSWFMLTESMLRINYRAIPDHIRACFGRAVREQRDLDHWHYDMLGQTMLVRDEAGDYTPAHKSLLEFFAAYKIAAELGIMNADFMALIGATSAESAPSFCWSELPGVPSGGRATAIGWKAEDHERQAKTLGAIPLESAVFDLLRPMLIEDVVESLVELVQATSVIGPSASGYTGAHIVELLMRLDATALRGRQLDGVILRESYFDRIDTVLDLTGCSLRSADLSETDMEDVDLTGADLTGADLTNARYVGFDRNAIHLVRTKGDLPILCVSRNGRVYRWDLSGDPSPVFTAPAEAESACTFSDGTTVTFWRDRSETGAMTGDMHRSSAEKDAGTVVRGSLIDVWEVDGKRYLLERRGVDSSGSLVLLDFESGDDVAETPFPFSNAVFDVNCDGRLFVLIFEDGVFDYTSRLIDAEVVELVLESPHRLRSVKRRDIKMAASDRDLFALYGRSGFAYLLAAEDGGTRIVLMDVDTNSSMTVDLPEAIVDYRSLFLRYGHAMARRFVLNRDGSVGAFAVGGGLVVVRLDDPRRRVLSISEDQNVSCALLTEQDVLVFADTYGGLSAYDIDSGEEIAAVNLNNKVRGATFLDVTGVEPAVRAHLARAGAIVD
ncbi:NACHT domain-containing protein [Paractinoplanes maris]|uniref:NACHT domain-containing protein n=1 Tax=Paractinoplanes maris TaxID=1734446 RepID=UPI0020209697|nr:pentapeptide repeat-containing protein [Actinoplanes maris]